MEWSKAKTILIICFLVGNLILGYQLYGDPRDHLEKDGEVLWAPGTEETSQSLRKAFADLDIEVEVSIPEDAPRMYALSVEHDEPEVKDFKQAFFSSGEEVENILVGGRLGGYRTEEAVLVLAGSGALRFQRVDSVEEEDMDHEEVREVAESFLDRPGLRPGSIQFDYKHLGEDIFSLFYTQFYRDTPIYGGGIVVNVKGGEVREYQRLWYRVTGYAGRLRQVMSATHAISENLMRIVKMIEESDAEKIVDINLGYYAGTKQQEEKWHAEPVWRIRLDDSSIIFINAFSGVIEWPK